MVASQAASAFLNFKAIGLLCGQILGQIIATGMFAKNILIEDKDQFNRNISRQSIRVLLKRYINFPKFDIPAAFTNVLSKHIGKIICF